MYIDILLLKCLNVQAETTERTAQVAYAVVNIYTCALMFVHSVTAENWMQSCWGVKAMLSYIIVAWQAVV